MKRIRIVGLALLALFAFGAIGSAAAQAVEAPYWGIESKRLGAGETAEVTVTQKAEYKLEAVGTGVSIKCETSAVAPSTIVGSKAGEPGTSKDKLKFTGCLPAGDGSPCAVGHEGNKEVVSESLKNELVYDAGSKESKSVAEEFTPEAGSVLAKLTLFGSGCSPVPAGVLSVTGAVAAQEFGGITPTEFLLELGRAPVLSTTNALKFPGTPITSVVLITNGVATQRTIGLSLGGFPSTLVGESEVKLVNKQKWCIIS